MAYYSRQAPRAYADNSGSEIVAMIGSAASTVAHGVEDYDTKQRKAQAAKEYQDRLLAARDLESMLKGQELTMEYEKQAQKERLDKEERERKAKKDAEEGIRSRQEAYASAMFVNPKDYGYGPGAGPMVNPISEPTYQPGNADFVMPWNQPSNQPGTPVQYRGEGKPLPEDSFEKALAIGSEAGFDLEQQRAFNQATQKPRDFAAEEEAKQRGRVELKNIWADVQKYAVDHKKFPPRSGRANAEDPIENETDALDQLLLIDRLKKTEQENSAGPGMPASPSAAKAAKWVNLDSQYFDWSRKNPELAKKAEAEYRKLKGK